MRIESDQVKTVAAILVVGAVFTFAGYLPQRKAQERIGQQMSDAQAQIDGQRVSVAGLKVLNEQVQSLQAEIDSARQYVPGEGELAPLLKHLSTRSQVQSLVDVETQTRPIVQHAYYSVIPVSMQFKGDFPRAFEFLRDIESLRRLVRIDRLEIDGAADRPGQPLAIKLELAAFFTDPRQQEANP